MANKPLKTITFPGLNDTYTVPQIDETLEVSGGAADAAVVGEKIGALEEGVSTLKDDLSNKADIDGYYENMGVGNADQLISNISEHDESPYLFRTSGGSIDIGNRETDKLVGGTVAWNQLLPNNSGQDSGTYGGITITKNGDGTYTLDGTCTTNYAYQLYGTFPHEINHKYLFLGWKQIGSNTGYYGIGDSPVDKGNGGIFNGISGTWHIRIDLRLNDVFDNFIFKPQVFNLTQMFGSTIADYAYFLEQASAGSGISWLKSYGFFTKDYYEYNPGELLSVKTSEHKMTGFNQWDEEWEVGAYNSANGKKINASGRIRSKNFIPVLPSTQYYCNKTLQVYYYDCDYNFISWTNFVNPSVISTPANCHYITFNCAANSGETYNNDICINLHWDGERDGEYEPYVEHTYPLDPVDLRGMFKLDANNKLYCDGDTYESDGTVTRKYGVVDLGTLNWTYDANNMRFYSSGIRTVAKPTPNNSIVGSIICPVYSAKAVNTMTSEDKAIFIDTVSFLYVKNTAYTDAATLKTAMSGVYLVYELTESSTETAEPYQNLQIVDDWGTEEYVDTRDVPIPVGHSTDYMANLKAKLEMSPDSPSGNGDYIVRQTNGENSYVPLVIPTELPSVPSSDGNYKLVCTISNGTATYAWESEA